MKKKILSLLILLCLTFQLVLNSNDYVFANDNKNQYIVMKETSSGNYSYL